MKIKNLLFAFTLVAILSIFNFNEVFSDKGNVLSNTQTLVNIALANETVAEIGDTSCWIDNRKDLYDFDLRCSYPCFNDASTKCWAINSMTC